MITYLKRNAISIVIGVALGTIIGIYASNHRTSTVGYISVEQFDYIETVPTPYEMPKVNVFEYDLYIDEDDLMLPEWEPVVLSDKELDVLARCVEAEAGNQDLYGRQLVVDVILNRVDDESFPDNVVDVVYQPNQFSVVTNGSINRVTPSDLTYEAIALECDMRTNENVLFFCSKGFLPYGQQWQKVGDHYFCVRKEGE